MIGWRHWRPSALSARVSACMVAMINGFETKSMLSRITITLDHVRLIRRRDGSRVVFVGGSRRTSPSLDLTFPSTGLSENLGGMERGRGGKGEREGGGDHLPYSPHPTGFCLKYHPGWQNGLNSDLGVSHPSMLRQNWTTSFKRDIFLLSIPTRHCYGQFQYTLTRLSYLVLGAWVVFYFSQQLMNNNTNTSRYFILVVTSLTRHCLWLAG